MQPEVHCRSSTLGVNVGTLIEQHLDYLFMASEDAA